MQAANLRRYDVGEEKSRSIVKCSMSPAHMRTREFQKSVASLSFRRNSLLRVGDNRYNEVVYTFAAIIYGCTVHAAAAST